MNGKNMKKTNTANGERFYTLRSRYPAMLFPMGWYYVPFDTAWFEKEFEVRIRKAGVFIKDGKRNAFVYPTDSFHVLGKNIVEKIQKQPMYLQNVKRKYLRMAREFNEWYADVNGTPLELLDQYSHRFIELHKQVYAIIFAGLDAIGNECKKFLGKEDFANLSRTRSLPYVLEYERDLYRQLPAEELQKKWFWIPYDYYGAAKWDVEDFRNQLATHRDETKRKELEEYEKRVRKEQRPLMEKLTPEQRHIVESFQTILFLHDHRKRTTNASYPFLQENVLTPISIYHTLSQTILSSGRKSVGKKNTQRPARFRRVCGRNRENLQDLRRYR